MSQQTGILATKVDLTFGRLDADGDGQLVKNDLEILADMLAGAFGVATEDGKVARLRTAMATIWDTDLIPMDTDSTGSVDRGEFRTGWLKALASDRAGVLGRFTTMAEAWLDLCDTDNSGTTTLDEYTKMATSTLGVPEADCTIAFQKLDRDSNGVLHRDEIRSAAEEYYTSDDPDALGNWLFGPIEGS
jgi:Ca2+-binding EF-hand superfamily protein